MTNSIVSPETEQPPSAVPEPALRVFGPYADRMVLQRNRRLKIAGRFRPGSRVSLTFQGQTAAAACDAGGWWEIEAGPFPPSAAPARMKVEAEDGSERLIFSDVLVGDVWLASGQSNMWWPLQDSAGACEESMTHPDLRLCTVPQRASLDPEAPAFRWEACVPSTARSFSAVAYHFGVTLARELGVPIGLIHASWGGTRIEAWMSRDALRQDPAGQRELERSDREAADPENQKAAREYGLDPEKWLRSRVPADPGNGAFDRGWADPEFDDASWHASSVPGRWFQCGPEFQQNGVFWFRRAVELPASWIGRDLVLRLGACDKHDTTYFNNVAVGGMGWEVRDAWKTSRVYRIPGRLVRAGRNVIATRIYSYMTDGGLIGPAGEMRLALADDPAPDFLALTGTWRLAIEHAFGPVPAPELPLGEHNENTPCVLFENMIRPMLGAALAGVIWYQGESNARQAKNYRSLFPLMIEDWRSGFRHPSLPFLYVQLANYQSPQVDAVESSAWAELREAQTSALALPATAMAVAIDLGETANIHPANKQDVGRRLAKAALHRVHGRNCDWSGPLFCGHALEGSKMRLRFQHATGLRTSDGLPPRTFAIAGPDGHFFHAHACIEGETVIVSSPSVPEPVAVRYAWANNPPVNLCNGAGLPAAPFRTDGEDMG